MSRSWAAPQLLRLRPRAGTLAWALVALVVLAGAAGAPYTVVANVLSHTLVRVGDSVAHPHPQVDVQCPEHPGLQCRTRVSGNQVLINVFHVPMTIEQKWEIPGTWTEEIETQDKSGREDDEEIEESMDENSTPKLVSEWSAGIPDRMQTSKVTSKTSEEFKILESESEESSARPGQYDLSADEILDETESSYDRYLKEDDITTSRSSKVDVNDFEERDEEYSSQDYQDENSNELFNDATTTETNYWDSFFGSRKSRNSNYDSSPDNAGSTENSIVTTESSENYGRNVNDNEYDDDYDGGDNKNEGGDSDDRGGNNGDGNENSEFNALEESPSSKPLLLGSWWPLS